MLVVALGVAVGAVGLYRDHATAHPGFRPEPATGPGASTDRRAGTDRGIATGSGPFSPPELSPGPSENGPPPPPPPPPPVTTVDGQDPLALAGAVATRLYQSPAGNGASAWVGATLSMHARRVFDAIAGRLGPASMAVPSVVQLLDPRAAPVVIQVDVVRWWTAGRAPALDPSPHLVRLTLLPGSGGRWSVDDIQVIS